MNRGMTILIAGLLLTGILASSLWVSAPQLMDGTELAVDGD